MADAIQEMAKRATEEWTGTSADKLDDFSRGEQEHLQAIISRHYRAAKNHGANKWADLKRRIEEAIKP